MPIKNRTYHIKKDKSERRVHNLLEEISKAPSQRHGETKKYIITWHVQPVKMSKRSGKYLSLALCSKNGGVAYYAIHRIDSFNNATLKILLIRDVYANGDCDDAQTCINLDCPLNKADLAKFKRKGIKTRHELEQLHTVLEDVVHTLKLKTGLENKIIIYDHHIAYLNRQQKEQVTRQR